MDEKEIISNNEMIALFMGAIHSIYFDGSKGLIFPSGKVIVHGARGCKYHESWNELIPVVEKIEIEDYGFKMCRKVVEIYRDSTKEKLFRFKESSRRESLYKAVIEFIEHYNKEKENEVTHVI